MSIFDKIESIEFDKNKEKAFGIKSAIVWGHSKSENSCSPILYISKPKWISQDEFNELLDSIEMKFKLNSI